MTKGLSFEAKTAATTKVMSYSSSTTQGRAVLAEDGITNTNEVPIGKPAQVFEFSVDEFVAGSC